MSVQKRNSFNRTLLILFLFAITVIAAPAQTRLLPRDSNQLIQRAQQFWTKAVSRQPTGAMEFVLPTKRDAFLTNPSSIISSAEVAGLDVTDDLKRAKVRVNATVQAPDGTRINLVFSNPWVWQDGKWYIDDDSPSVFNPLLMHSESAFDPVRETKEIDDHLRLIQNVLDLGTIEEGQTDKRVEVPVFYDGSVALKVHLLPAPNFVHVANIGEDGLTSKQPKFFLYLNTSNLQGDYSVPLRIQFAYGSAIVERSMTVKMKVFAPIAFRMELPTPVLIGVPYTTYVRNNTSQRLRVAVFSVGEKTEVLKSPDFLEPNAEGEFVWKLTSGAMSPSVSIQFDEAVGTRKQFEYILPK